MEAPPLQLVTFFGSASFTITIVYINNIVFRRACCQLKIPYITWVHGGYGATYSLHANDVLDFRLCENHISYGVHLEDLINDDKCVLKKFNFQNDLKFFAVGSPRFDYANKNRIVKYEVKSKEKYTILYIVGCHQDRNRFYYDDKGQKVEEVNCFYTKEEGGELILDYKHINKHDKSRYKQ